MIAIQNTIMANSSVSKIFINDINFNSIYKNKIHGFLQVIFIRLFSDIILDSSGKYISLTRIRHK